MGWVCAGSSGPDAGGLPASASVDRPRRRAAVGGAPRPGHSVHLPSAAHLRRALLLFAIVLAVAALAASFSRSGNSGDPLAPPDPNATQSQTESDTSPSAAPGDPGLDERNPCHARVRRRRGSDPAAGAGRRRERRSERRGARARLDPPAGCERPGRAGNARPLRPPGLAGGDLSGRIHARAGRRGARGGHAEGQGAKRVKRVHAMPRLSSQAHC